MWLMRCAEIMSFAAGTFLLALALRNTKRGAASRNWPLVPGTIVRSFVLVDEDSEGGKGYTPRVEYDYVVEGKKYRGTRLRYGQTGNSNRERAERVILSYPADSSVPVFFNPSRHDDAVLLRGLAWGNLFIVLAGLVFLGAGVLLSRGVR